MATKNCLLALICIGVFTECISDIIIQPYNVAVVKGSPVSLKCSTDRSAKLRWFKVSPVTQKEDIIFTGMRITNDFESAFFINDDENGSFELMINSSIPDHAGTYICEEMISSIKYRAELIVLESKPICNFNLSTRTSSGNRSAQVWCTIAFHGNWAPMMEWNRDDTPIATPTKVDNRTTANDSVTYTLTLMSHDASEDLRCSCETRFDGSMRPNSTDALNTPDFIFVWTLVITPSTLPDHTALASTNAVCFSSSTILVGLLLASVLATTIGGVCFVLNKLKKKQHRISTAMVTQTWSANENGIPDEYVSSTSTSLSNINGEYMSMVSCSSSTHLAVTQTQIPTNLGNSSNRIPSETPGAQPDHRKQRNQKPVYENVEARTRLEKAFKHDYCNEK